MCISDKEATAMAQEKLADEIVSLDDDDVRVRIAEAMYRFRVARLNFVLAVAYWIAMRIHGQEKTSLLFCRFLLHAKRVENNDFIEQMLNAGVTKLRRGALNPQQFVALASMIREMRVRRIA